MRTLKKTPELMRRLAPERRVKRWARWILFVCVGIYIGYAYAQTNYLCEWAIERSAEQARS